jgi:predicted metal-dependent HD superfamily phosphohydrolase
MQERLQQQLKNLLEDAGAEANERARSALAFEVIAAYQQPHRHYHNLEHLQAVLEELDALRAVARLEAVKRSVELDEVAVELAAFFHDVVYSVDGVVDSERESAHMGRQRLRLLNIPAERVEEVERLILLTAGHNPQADDVAGAWLCDADLMVLAWPRERYLEYVAAVRGEYEHVPAEAWARGRSQVLEGLLASPRLYALAPTEVAARANLRDELAAIVAESYLGE